MRKWTTFDARPSPEGQVRVGVWDRVCVPGHDEKDDHSTDFDVSTLSQMVDNFLARNGDPIPLDYDHQSQKTHLNGKPAIALAFYGALAVVWDGKVVKFGVGRDTPPCPDGLYVSPSTARVEDIDASRDGLWCYRNEVTAHGMDLLRAYKLVSPTFLSEGTTRDGKPVGYCLCAVAATNSPWQSSTELTFDNNPAPAAAASNDPAAADAVTADAAASAKKESKMPFSPEMMAKLGLSAESTPEEKEAAFASYFDASEAQFAAAAAPTEMEGDKGDDDKKDEEEEPAKMEKDDSATEAKMAAMEARLAKFERAEAQRAKAEQAAREHSFSQLADQAIGGGYPKEKRDALIRFARVDFEGARATVESFLPKTGAPAHVFSRMTSQGAPVGGETSPRQDNAIVKPKAVKTAFGRFVETDGSFAEAIRKTAESSDPFTAAKVDKLLSAGERPQMFSRLLAAEKIVRAERPDLADSADSEE